MSGMNPMLLQKQLKENTNDLQEYFKDIKLWGEEMKRKEEAMKNQGDNKDEAPPPRNKIAKVKKAKETAKEDKNQPKIPKEYNFWEKFDAEAECEKIDAEKSDDSDSDLTDEVDEAMIDLAMEEKEKGNKFVKSGRYEDAIKCYTNAIESYSYDPVFYANRALCYLKLKQYKAAEVDCTTSLQIDKEYVKALHRRALAREALEQYAEAVNDLETVLEIDPKNKESKLLLEKVKKKVGMETHEPTLQRPLSKFTISRQKCRDTKTTAEITEIEDESITPAIKPNVYERINPLDKQPKSNQPQTLNEPQPSTSKAKVPPKQSEINWPSGDNVQIVPGITKSPKDRSKLPLKRVQIYDVDSKSNLKLEAKPVKIEANATPQPEPENFNFNKILIDDFKVVERKPAENVQVNTFENLDCNVDVSNLDFTDLNIPPPTTSVQFYQNWKNLDKKKRFLYLRQINPARYASIFKDSLESKVFSEVINVFGNAFVEDNVPVFEYLYGLTKVKRFGALVMFKTGKDKEELLKLIDAMRTDSRYSKDEVDYLIKKYEM